MYRRSNSSSHIPLAKGGELRRSKSAIRSSGVKRSTGTTPVSTTTRGSNVGKYTTPSISSKGSTVKKTSLLTPSVPSTLFKRSTSNLTPSYRASRSPYKIGSENDKEWVNEKVAKIRMYLQSNVNFPEAIFGSFKPPITIETFVFIVNLLFKEINPGLTVQNSNYKTVVATTLKMLHYPGNIKNSFLQTVNTKHAWRDVVSMFSWLVDLITAIKSASQAVVEDDGDLKHRKVEWTTNFLVKRYMAYNGDGNAEEIDRQFSESLAQLLNVDEDELKALETEVARLHKFRETELKKLEDQRTKNEHLTREIECMQNDIDSYYETKAEREDNTKYCKGQLQERLDRLKTVMSRKKERVAEIAAVIDKQKYTINDKKRTVQRLDELQHTIALKKESIKEKNALKDDIDFKLTEAKKELQTQVYHFNNRLMKLASVEPQLKVLYLEEKDFLSKDFQNDMENLSKNYNTFKNTFSEEYTKISSSISDMKTDARNIAQQKKFVQESTEKLKESMNLLETKIETVDKEVEMLSKQRQENKSICLQKIAEMKQSELNLESNKKKLKNITEIYNKKANDFEIKKQRALEFFRNLHNIIVGNLEEMNKIRTEVFEMLADCLTKVAETEEQIFEDLRHLDEVREK